MKRQEFTRRLRVKGRELYRPMPWRDDTRGYYVLVSELMLQQTQVGRVKPKFEAFIRRFPSVEVLAEASLADVLTLWSGLGYNRRAKFLHDAAKKIAKDYKGQFPDTKEALLGLPGVGPNTAGAIMAYTFNRPEIFIETNVRTVYFHEFFAMGDKVADNEIRALLEETIDREHPREFYWALMDYGTWLKSQGTGRITQSRHYKKQSPLKGSVREVRGQIIQVLTSGGMSLTQLKKDVMADERFAGALAGLKRDGLVVEAKSTLHLTK